MYNATHLDWETVLDIHAAIVIEIERGNRRWGDSFWDIESRVWHTKQSGKKGNTQSFSGKSNAPKSNSGQGVMFCKAYQSGKCTKQSPHNVIFGGKKYLVTHICATCWIVEKEKRSHPESSSDCKWAGKSIQEAKEACK